jgi:hypothetical protein
MFGAGPDAAGIWDNQVKWANETLSKLPDRSRLQLAAYAALPDMSTMLDAANIGRLNDLMADVKQLSGKEGGPDWLPTMRRVFVEYLSNMAKKDTSMMWCNKQIPLAEFARSETVDQNLWGQALDSLFFMSIAALLNAFHDAGIAITSLPPGCVGVRKLVADEPGVTANRCAAIKMPGTVEMVLRHYNVVPSILIGGASGGVAQMIDVMDPSKYGLLLGGIKDVMVAFHKAAPGKVPVLDSADGVFRSPLGYMQALSYWVTNPDELAPYEPVGTFREFIDFIESYAVDRGCNVTPDGFKDVTGILDWRPVVS